LADKYKYNQKEMSNIISTLKMFITVISFGTGLAEVAIKWIKQGS